MGLPRRVYAGYFALQAVAGVGFWLVVALSGPGREVFEMAQAQPAALDSFLFADIALGIVGSAVAAAALWRGTRWGAPWALFVAGGLVYATVYIVGWVAYTGDGSGLLALMLLPSTLSTWSAAQALRLRD